MLRQSNLLGINIPGSANRLIATLFADDTTMYLSEYDDFYTLEALLSKWCQASRARFNINKTEIIPIGTSEYRKQVLTTRTLHPASTPIPQTIWILEDGQSVRILGTWVGNNASAVTPWLTILEKISSRLAIWETRHSDLVTRKHLVNQFIRATTQYLTAAQGMPDEITTRLQKTIGDFIWADHSSPLINRATLEHPVEEGGLGLVNLWHRNKSIQAVKLKLHLNLDDPAPWSPFMNAVMGKYVTAKAGDIQSWAKINTFLQSWDVPV
ncbi:hypothetical protein OE88DRAFT_1621574 [Heliocybe sulcata]|uniref:Reverse transcriptase domain-containing protein n=1 Tax=Heliocybe sulcata TaxID=5364 RepID=A0A5C3NIC3_9AGAM|nr:hypothetical protein OE88DRAFT_1621574 [Heliocybe sulcata]